MKHAHRGCVLGAGRASGALAQTSVLVVPPQYAVAVGPIALCVGESNSNDKLDVAEILQAVS
jgi:hypothetical protein